MPENNLIAARRIIEDLFNRANPDNFTALIDEDVIIHDTDKEIIGMENVRNGINNLHTAFPDLEYEVQDIFDDEDKVVLRCKGSGTHLGSFRQIPATGKKMQYHVILIWRFSKGKLVEHWSVSDVFGMLQQLEVIQIKTFEESKEKSSNVSVETLINAPIEKVWRAWTEPALVMGWFGSDPGGKVLKAALDVRPGGYFEVTFRDADLTEHTCSGIYKEVQEYSRLTFSWNWKSEPGIESFIILTLVSENKVTNMRLEHINPGTASKHDYIKGWQSTFSKLERMLNPL